MCDIDVLSLGYSRSLDINLPSTSNMLDFLFISESDNSNFVSTSILYILIVTATSIFVLAFHKFQSSLFTGHKNVEPYFYPLPY